MDYSLWTDASTDVEAEQRTARLVRAKVAVAPLWPFLALARGPREFEHRLALVAERITEVAGDLTEPVTASLREDFQHIAADRDDDEDDGGDEDSESDGDGKPDWLKDKINSTSAWYHQGRKEWMRAGPVIPEPERAFFFHSGLGRWIALDDDSNSGKGNPHYFDGGPEGGPNTGQTSQYPTFPPGVTDPIDPLNQMFPMQPTPWTGGVEWQETPMNFSPPRGQTAARGRRPFVQAERARTQIGDTDTCVDCGLPVRYVQSKAQNTSPWWSHTGVHGIEADDHHLPLPSRHAALDVPNPGNSHYFDAGSEGVSGDDDEHFPADIARGVDPVDPADWYGNAPIQPLSSAGTPHHPAPDSDVLLGTDFDSEQERQRWHRALHGQDPGNHDSTALTGARHTFFDPNDRGVVVVALGDPNAPQPQPTGGGTNPVGGTPQPPPAMMNGPGSTAMPPLTTKPRQIPSGGGADPGMTGVPDPSQQPAGTTGMRRHALGVPDDDDSRNVPTADDPTGLGDEYRDKTVEGPLRQRPRQPADHRNVNTPQRPAAPVPTRSSSDMLAQQDEEDRREASRIAHAAVLELVGAR